MAAEGNTAGSPHRSSAAMAIKTERCHLHCEWQARDKRSRVAAWEEGDPKLIAALIYRSNRWFSTGLLTLTTWVLKRNSVSVSARGGADDP